MQLGFEAYKQELDSDVENKLYTFFAPVNRAIELMRLTKVGKSYLDRLRIVDKGPSVVNFASIKSRKMFYTSNYMVFVAMLSKLFRFIKLGLFS